MPTDDELLQADRRSRDDALDIERSAIVQAPAGSGKTELLIQRYLKLLAVVQSPEEILAITFTRKAALEMQLRVIDALRRAERGEEPAADHERITFSAATAALERDRKLEWHLVQSPGRMRIQTVDSFAAGIARSLPLTSGLGGIDATLSGEQMNAMYREAAAATFDNLGSEQGEFVERVLLHLDNNHWLYISHLSRMLAYRDQWLQITGSGLADEGQSEAARVQLERNIEAAVVHELDRLVDRFPADCAAALLALLDYAAGRLREHEMSEHPLCRIVWDNQLPGSSPNDRAAWQAIAGLLLTQQGTWRKSINRNDGFPPQDDGQKQSLLELIGRMQEIPKLLEGLRRVRLLPEPRYVDAQWEVLLALLSLLPLAVAELKRLFGERGVSDHIEVAIAAEKALGTAEEPGDIALILDYQVRHLLVDEMQDTSISQYRLLRKLVAGWTQGDGRSLFCVGDPMQSIYRFRDAEVGQFLLARRDGIGEVRPQALVLRRNFRSGERLVHWFNTIFSQIMPLEDDIACGAISYSASVPVDAHADSGAYRVHPLFGANLAEEANYTLGVIRECLERHPGDDVAVLVRSRTILSPLLYELRLAGIPYQAVEIDSLTDLPEIIDLLALTRALCHEADRLAWLALIRGPWVGLTWSDIHALVRNDASSTVLELVSDASRLRALSGDARDRLRNFREKIGAFVQSSATGTLRDRVELAWYALGGPCVLRDAGQADNVYRFLDVIDKIETAGSISDVQDLERLLDRELVSSRFDPACRLQVMTMHKAKGLQFDHVVLYGLGRQARRSDRAVLSWLVNLGDDREGAMILSPVGPRAEVENDPLHQFIESTEREKEQLEQDRLLYVACTRARESLNLVGHVGLSADGDAIRPPAAGTLLHRLWPALQSQYEAAFETSGIAEDEAGYEEDESHLVPPVLKRLAVDPPSTAPTLPGGSSGVGRPTRGSESTVEYHWVGAAARHAGTIVHRCLQHISDGRAELHDRDTLRRMTRYWVRGLGVKAGEADAVCERVETALERVANDEQGKRLLFGAGKSELALTGVIDGSVQSVVLDRIHIDQHGVHWIVDYKTSTHEGGDLAGFLEQEKDRYRPQLQKYASVYGKLTDAPVKTALYFPLLQEFVEVD